LGRRKLRIVDRHAQTVGIRTSFQFLRFALILPAASGIFDLTRVPKLGRGSTRLKRRFVLVLVVVLVLESAAQSDGALEYWRTAPSPNCTRVAGRDAGGATRADMNR
jgi:hypothetical protein